jgi:DNA-binding SARP family transcriptional activator/tetratricopeptide (TPR) repeat protein
VRFRILGPLEIWTGEPGSWCAIGAPKWRALLGVLLARHGEVVAVDRLVDEIWGQRPPAHARKLVNVYALRLRRLLGDPAGGLLATRSPGYLLRCGDRDVDACLFEAGVAAGRRELAAGRAEEAAELLSAAIRLWRGAPLADVPPGPIVRAEVNRLAEARLDALRLRIEADLGCGRHKAAVTDLRGLVTEHRLSEAMWGLLLRALAGAGRQAEALEAYAQARQVIGEELGTEPGEDLRDLHRRLLAGENLTARAGAGFAAASARGTAPASAAASARGTAPAGSAASAFTTAPDAITATTEVPEPPPSQDAPVCQLPPDVTDFTGRALECAGLTELLAPVHGRTAVPVAVISGPPGAGKTALALHVAHSLRKVFPHGQLFAPLGGASALPREPGEVLGELLRALGVGPTAIPETLEQRAALFRSRLAGRAVLVVADDAASLAQVRPLLPGTAGCAVMVTSRDRLAGLCGAGSFPLDPLGHDEAVEMLGRIVGTGRVAAEPQAADSLVAACGRLPLAVRIAAAKLAARPWWPVSKVANLVADERRRLDELAVGDLEVRASVAPSYEALDESARRAFRLLGLLGPHDFAAWVVAALLGEPDADDVIDVLVDKSLLTPAGVDGTGQPRYRLHDLLRDYAAERVAADEPGPDRDAALDRVLTGLLELAGLADRGLPRLALFPAQARLTGRTILPEHVASRLTADPLAWFTAERLNLLTAVSQACARQRRHLAAQLASYQSTFHYFHNRVDDADQMWEAITQAAHLGEDQAMVARGEFGRACALAIRGRHADTLETLDRCIPVLEQFNDPATLAAALYWRSFCSDAQELHDMAQQDAERCLRLARELGDRSTEVMALRMLGLAVAKLGDPEAGIALCEQALTIAQELQEPAYEHLALNTAANLAIVAGRHDVAADYCQRGMQLSDRLGLYVTGEAYFLGLLSDTYYGRGRYQEAIDALSQALPVFEQHGDRRSRALCLLKLGYAHRAVGRHEQAISYVEESLPILHELRLPHEERAEQALAEIRAATADG